MIILTTSCTKNKLLYYQIIIKKTLKYLHLQLLVNNNNNNIIIHIAYEMCFIANNKYCLKMKDRIIDVVIEGAIIMNFIFIF